MSKISDIVESVIDEILLDITDQSYFLGETPLGGVPSTHSGRKNWGISTRFQNQIDEID